MKAIKTILCTLLLASWVGAAVPTSQPYAIDRAFYVSPAGSDATGDGSKAKPFASVAKADTAITVARFTRPTTSNDAILVQVGTYDMPWAQGINNDNCVVSVTGNNKPGDRAVFNFHGGGFNVGGHRSVHFIGIDAEATNRSGFNEDIAFNVVRSNSVTPDDFTFDNCVASGFAQGISFLSDNGGRLRVWGGNFSGAYLMGANGIPQKAQGIYHEGSCADIRYNVIAYNGWAGDLNNPAVVTALMFSHGVYASASHNPKPGISNGNFYICNAASGLQLRTGGTIFGDVFVANGIACDTFTDGASGDIVGNLVLGCRDTTGVLFTGGGLLAQSDRQVIGGNVFLRSNPTGAPALLLGWNSGGNDITGTAKPSTNALGALTGNYGVWPGPASQVTVGRAFQTVDGNAIKTPPASVPDLIDWAQTVGFTGSNHRDLVAWLKANPDKADAAAAIVWGQQQAAKLVPPVVNPAPTPAPFPITLQIDPVKQTAVQVK